MPWPTTSVLLARPAAQSAVFFVKATGMWMEDVGCAAPLTSTGDLTVFMVTDPAGSNPVDHGAFNIHDGGFLLPIFFRLLRNVDTWFGYSGPTHIALDQAGGPISDRPQIVTLVRSTTNGGALYVDREKVATNGMPYSAATLDELVVGDIRPQLLGSYFNGDIAELIVYGVELPSEGIESVEAYLSQRYGIPIAFTLEPTPPVPALSFVAYLALIVLVGAIGATAVRRTVQEGGGAGPFASRGR